MMMFRGQAKFRGTTGQEGILQQDVGIEAGKKYRVAMSIDDWDVFNIDYLQLSVYLGGTNVWLFCCSGDQTGTYVYEGFEPANTDSLQLWGNVGPDERLNVDVGYISVKEQVPGKFIYDCENRLTDVNDTVNDPVAKYAYDYLGRRISKTTYDTDHQPQGTSHVLNQSNTQGVIGENPKIAKIFPTHFTPYSIIIYITSCPLYPIPIP
jgi:YD repeat-containing protein